MVGYECPCITAGFGFGDDSSDPIQKVISICIIEKDLSPLDSSNDDVMERSRSIYSGFSWHDIPIALEFIWM